MRDRFRSAIGEAGSRRRRFVTVTAAAALVVLVTVIVPGYYASQPAFLTRFPSLAAEHETWAGSVHNGVACQKCHVRPGIGPQTQYSAKMLGEFYLTMVLRDREPKLLKTPANASCGSTMCHFQLRTVSATGDLRIPHRAHVNALEMKCVTCHEFLVHELSPEGKHKPRMTACLSCHNGQTAKNGCTTCHTDKAAPEGHQAKDWVVVHASRQAQEDCKSCHAWVEDWCVECHTRKPASHTAKWRSEHGAVVKDRRNCDACHTGDFCERCHGEVPRINIETAPKLVQ